jgi:hypothetical protein
VRIGWRTRLWWKNRRLKKQGKQLIPHDGILLEVQFWNRKTEEPAWRFPETGKKDH